MSAGQALLGTIGLIFALGGLGVWVWTLDERIKDLEKRR